MTALVTKFDIREFAFMQNWEAEVAETMSKILFDCNSRKIINMRQAEAGKVYRYEIETPPIAHILNPNLPATLTFDIWVDCPKPGEIKIERVLD